MDVILNPVPAGPVVYPDSDGKPMAENTRQYEWIVTIKGNLEAICVGDRAAFVAGDNLIYPVEGDPTIRTAPDVYVAFGRPRGHRGSYRVWEEGGVFPQVVFEVLSPGNTVREMSRKRQFYRRHGAEEYYVYDPDRNMLQGWLRSGRRFVSVADMHNFVSPLLGIRFDMSGLELEIFDPDGNPFLTFAQLKETADTERERANTEHRRAEQERKRAEKERQRAEKLAAKLRELGVDPNTL